MKTIKRIELHVTRERLAESKTPYNVCIQCPEQAIKIVRSVLEGVDQEVFLVLPMDIRNKVLGFTEVAKGAVDYCHVDPREVFRTAIVLGASAIVLAHNHPSGDPAPSNEDIKLTERLLEAGVILGLPILDHLIIAQDKSASFAELGLITGGTIDE